MGKLIVKKTEWDLSKLLKGDDDPSIEEKKKIITKHYMDFAKKWKNRDDYLKQPEILKLALDEYNDMLETHGEGGGVLYYFYLKSHLNHGDPNIKAEYNKISDFIKKLENETNFFILRLSKISPEIQQKVLSYPGLNKYRHRLETIFRNAKHLLGEEAEKILNLKSKNAYKDWVDMTTKFLSKEERAVLMEDGSKKTKSFSEIISLTHDKNKKVRDSAAQAFNDILAKYADVAEAEINAILENKKIDDELRKIPRPDYTRHLEDDIDSNIVDILIETVSERFNISRRFYHLMARLMKVDKLDYHERNVAYGKMDKQYSYDEAINIVYNVFKSLDDEFAGVLYKFNENGNIDVYPKKGKQSGAFCVYWSKSHPVYVMLNFANNIDDIITIAHEFGHAINDELMRKKQNGLNFGTPKATAEVASTFMEDFVLEKIMEQADDELKLALMVMKLNRLTSTIQRQAACYKFEQELHKRFREIGYLSKEEIGKIFQKHMSAYMGDYVEQSKGSENWWVYWWHIRMFFYVYSYVSGILISKALQNHVRKDKSFINNVKEFLSTGLSESPRNIFLKMGIDIADKRFWNHGLDEQERLLDEAEKLAKKLGKI